MYCNTLRALPHFLILAQMTACASDTLEDELRVRSKSGGVQSSDANSNVGLARAAIVPSHSIVGVIDGVYTQADGTDAVSGWACNQGDPRSIDVHLYVGGPAGSGTLAAWGTANLGSEPAVANACRSNGSAYRFSIPLAPIEGAVAGKSIWIHGISHYPDSPNDIISNSGRFQVPSHSIVGVIDGVYTQADGTDAVSGWACNQGDPRSINVHLYVGGPAGSGTLAAWGTANLGSEPAVANACRSNGSAYRFQIRITDVEKQHHGEPIYLHGISLFADSTNALIARSGQFTVPNPCKSGANSADSCSACSTIATCESCGPQFVFSNGKCVLCPERTVVQPNGRSTRVANGYPPNELGITRACVDAAWDPRNPKGYGPEYAGAGSCIGDSSGGYSPTEFWADTHGVVWNDTSCYNLRPLRTLELYQWTGSAWEPTCVCRNEVTCLDWQGYPVTVSGLRRQKCYDMNAGWTCRSGSGLVICNADFYGT